VYPLSSTAELTEDLVQQGNDGVEKAPETATDGRVEDAGDGAEEMQEGSRSLLRGDVEASRVDRP
jgi:hypothetical protein